MIRTLFLLSVTLFTSITASLAADELTIQQIEQRAHLPGRAAGKKPLYKEVLAGTATKEQKQELLDLYLALAKAKPAKGSQEAWQKATATLVTAAQEIVRGEVKDGSNLQAALNCKGCHAAHRPVYAIDGTLVEDAGDFGTAAPPQFVKLANISKDKLSISVYAFEPHVETSFREEEVEADGVKSVRKVPVMETVQLLRQSQISLAYVRLFDSTGKEVKGDEVWNRLKPGMTLLRQTGSKQVDPVLLKLLSPEALILAPSILPSSPAEK